MGTHQSMSMEKYNKNVAVVVLTQVSFWVAQCDDLCNIMIELASQPMKWPSIGLVWPGAVASQANPLIPISHCLI